MNTLELRQIKFPLSKSDVLKNSIGQFQLYIQSIITNDEQLRKQANMCTNCVSIQELQTVDRFPVESYCTITHEILRYINNSKEPLNNSHIRAYSKDLETKNVKLSIQFEDLIYSTIAFTQPYSIPFNNLIQANNNTIDTYDDLLKLQLSIFNILGYILCRSLQFLIGAQLLNHDLVIDSHALFNKLQTLPSVDQKDFLKELLTFQDETLAAKCYKFKKTFAGKNIRQMNLETRKKFVDFLSIDNEPVGE